jgi:hypothetical protein
MNAHDDSHMINGYSPIHPRGIGTTLPFETHGQMFPRTVKWAFCGTGPGDVIGVGSPDITATRVVD